MGRKWYKRTQEELQGQEITQGSWKGCPKSRLETLEQLARPRKEEETAILGRHTMSKAQSRGAHTALWALQEAGHGNTLG